MGTTFSSNKKSVMYSFRCPAEVEGVLAGLTEGLELNRTAVIHLALQLLQGRVRQLAGQGLAAQQILRSLGEELFRDGA